MSNSNSKTSGAGRDCFCSICGQRAPASGFTAKSTFPHAARLTVEQPSRRLHRVAFNRAIIGTERSCQSISGMKFSDCMADWRLDVWCQLVLCPWRRDMFTCLSASILWMSLFYTLPDAD